MYTDYSVEHLTPSPCTKCKYKEDCNWECPEFIKWADDYQKWLKGFFSKFEKKSKVSEKSF